MRYIFLPLAVGLIATCAWGQQYTITTFAGNGAAGFTGDGGAAASAQLSSPNGMAFDSSGNLYIADALNQRVRKISGGTITTVAGNGTAGFSGDKAAATSAELRYPSGVALDSAGNLYIADTDNHVIRMVSTGGTITTIAGNNTGGYAGDGGLAVNAELEFPGSVAVDSSGNIFIADSGNGVIREVTGGNIITIAGLGLAGVRLQDPEGIILDGQGNLYISDSDGLRIQKFDLAKQIITVVAGSGNIGFSGDFGPAPEADLNNPKSMALDSNGYVYIADTNNNRIRKVAPDGIITTIAGQGPATYSGDNGPATSATISFPHGIAVDASGNVYIADTGNNAVRLLKPVTPTILTGGVVNAASFTANVSPGSLATVFGSDFIGAGQIAGASLPLPLNLGGVAVTVNGKAAPVLFVDATQVNFQIPWDTAAGPAAIVVSSNGIASASVNATVLEAAPGLFVLGARAIVQNFPDFSLNGPGSPAKAGSTIIAYFTGGGAVSPAVADGAAGDSNASVGSVTATIGSQPATVTFAGLAPGFVGLWQANITVPSVSSTADLPLTISAGGQTSNAGNVSVTP
jgi:uncharacterized protein (TIGR03437 family)